MCEVHKPEKLKFGRVLVISNSRFSVITIIRLLEKEGNKLTFCENAGEAIDALRKQTFDLIICDTLIPHGEEFSSEETAHGTETGQAILKFAKELQPDIGRILLVGKEATEKDIADLGPDTDFFSVFDETSKLGAKFRKEKRHA